jgi:hypothetical protein
LFCTTSGLSPLSPCDDHIHRSAPAARANESISPIEHAGPGAIILPGHLGGVGLDLAAARLTPHDESDARRGRVTERHRRPGRRFHEPRALIPEIDIWRVAALMLKRYGDEAMMESAEQAEHLAADAAAVGAANLAPGYRRDRSTHEYNTAEAGALIGTPYAEGA